VEGSLSVSVAVEHTAGTRIEAEFEGVPVRFTITPR
jgi:hypothetical protein